MFKEAPVSMTHTSCNANAPLANATVKSVGMLENMTKGFVAVAIGILVSE